MKLKTEQDCLNYISKWDKDKIQNCLKAEQMPMPELFHYIREGAKDGYDGMQEKVTISIDERVKYLSAVVKGISCKTIGCDTKELKESFYKIRVDADNNGDNELLQEA